VSKGRFAISINVICVGIRSGLPKRQYRVVMAMDYVGGPLRHRGKRQGSKAGYWLFRGAVMARVRIWENSELPVGFRGWLLRE
jgi:hypothetical protein